MKIAFIIEYFFPFDKGGSQWSTYYLAKDLIKAGHEVTIITPNYGSNSQEFISGIKIARFPFYKKSKNFNNIPGNFFFTNPIFIIWAAVNCFLAIRKERPQIIHVHGKYSIPPVRLANIFLRLPIIATIRDYIAICNYGICLTSKERACTTQEYFKNDFTQYYEQYVVKKNLFNVLTNILFSIWGRISSKLLKYFAKDLKVVVLSNVQKKIFQANGFKSIDTIPNSFEFPKSLLNTKKENQIVYAGRFTPGKGVNLLIDIIPKFAKLFPSYKLIFVGDGFLKIKLKQTSKNIRNVEILGSLPHEKLVKLFSKSKIVIAPSVWPEPFGRSVLESIAVQTPVIVTVNSGLAEVIAGRWGQVTDPNAQSIISSIKRLVQENEVFVKRIKRDHDEIARTFSSEVSLKYLKLYKGILK